ncbi:AraC family transcriptional regulator [Bordetella sp. LUAb4]|uniref:AraC family transcriptional regulator n=1 Tax=Bordetella sp. LUAb4 TaxID=2843195 RepID=UPI001E4C61FA|nr:AraC family transcriptional regulator [Bordetella sp. LUAb4]
MPSPLRRASMPAAVPDTEAADIAPVTLRQLMADALRGGHDPAVLCDGTGFQPEDLYDADYRVSRAQCAHVIRRALRLLGRPALGLELGAAVNPASWGLVSLGFMTCRNSRELLDFAIEHQHECGRLLSLHGEDQPQTWCLVGRSHFHERAVDSFVVDHIFAAMAQICRQVVGDLFNPRLVELASERPSYGAVYEHVFRCPVRFGAARNRLHFPRDPYAVRSADAVVLAQVRRDLAARADRRPVPSELHALVAQAIRKDLAAPMALGAVAASLHTSERTLRRRLEEQGLTYAGLLEEERRARAMALLTQSSRNVQQIAAECGYANARTLQRAVQRWTGLSPTGLRRRSRAGA